MHLVINYKKYSLSIPTHPSETYSSGEEMNRKRKGGDANYITLSHTDND